MAKAKNNKEGNLGAKNTKVPTPEELKAAADAKVIATATSYKLETEGKTVEELEVSIAEVENLQAEIKAHARNAEIVAHLAEYLGVEDLEALTKEEVKTLLAEKEAATTNTTEKVEKEVVVEGRTEKAFEASNGNKYVFTEDAPAKFRYLGILRTQEEWIADKDSMELMIAGSLSFLTLKK